MGARVEGEESRSLYGGTMDLRAAGKRSVEWDLNDWKWDGDLFVARQLNHHHHGSSDSFSSCSDGGNVETLERRRIEKKQRRALSATATEKDHLRDDDDNERRLTLKLGGGGDGGDNTQGNGANKTKLGGGIPSRAVCCQVENCGADLSKGKDYYRRHKVCEMHSKATSSLVGGIMQRFCQQCSRFHVLEEFDEGKRSCRRRLAGHNKRRRKANPDTLGNGNLLSDAQTSNYLLISLLKIISSIHSNQSDHTGGQDLLSHLLKSLASQAGEHIGKNLVELPQGRGGRQASQNIGNSSALVPTEQAPREDINHHSVNVHETPWQQQVYADGGEERSALDRSQKQVKMNNFDLNDIYIDSDDIPNIERSSPPPTNPATSSLDYHLESRQSSPPQTSRNSDSASDQSLSSSTGVAQGRTNRIVFKLFGKEPNDFPVALRGQILDWLAHCPTDMESYIRPGCVVLTIYLRQDEASWEELCCDLSFSLRRLLDLSDDPLWTDGWIYFRVQNQLAFAFNGQVVLDTSLPLRSHDYSQIITVRPLAVTRKAQFTVKGINLRRPGTKLLCAVEGTYLVEEATRQGTEEERDDPKEQNEFDIVKFSCEMPIASGRGFMEIEDQGGLSSSFYPFIVSEDEDVCSDIQRLESTLEFAGTDSAMQAMDFIHEIGWLLHRSGRLERSDASPEDLFPLVRFKFLIEFSMDREWCAVIKKLLNILFEEGTVDPSPDAALSELCLLHRAVRKNSKAMVEMLLRFIPKTKSQTLMPGLFRPDAAGPAGLTPLHIAAGKDGSEDVLDALTEDPGMIGVQAWKMSRDKTGFTPEDYARLRGHFSYIHLVQRKLSRKPIGEEHVVVNIPESFNIDHKQEKRSRMEMTRTDQCKLCDRERAFATMQHRSFAYRPAMLSMIAIAAVCVCVALLFKSCPEVLYVFQPFRWELLEYGTS